jgi:Domain of unknown function (DUF4836)
MKLKLTLSLVAVCLQQVFVFAQNSPLLKYLPDSASMVLSISLPRLGSKIPGEAFRQSMLYEKMMKENQPAFHTLLSNAAQSGIDISTDLLLATTAHRSEEFSATYIHLIGSLKNESLFTPFIKSLLKADSIYTFGVNKIIFKNGGTLAWNNEVFIFSAGKYKNLPDNDMDSLSSGKYKEKMRSIQKALCFAMLTPKPGNFFSTDNHFIRLVNTPGDIKIWSNGSPNPAMSKINPLAGFMKSFSYFSSSKTAVINFENGEIVVKSSNYLNNEIAGIYKKYPSPALNTDLTRRLPKGKLLGLVITSYNPEMGKELMEKSGMMELLDNMKEKLPFDLSTIQGAFKNNMMLAVIKKDEVWPDSVTTKKLGIELLLAIPIADKTKFETLKAGTSRIWDSLKNTGGYSKMLKGFNPVVKYNDEFFVMSSSADMASAFLNGPGNENPPEWLQSYTHHPMVMSINLKELFAIIMDIKSKGKKASDKQAFPDIFDRVIISGGDYENDALNTTIEFKFSNQTENSLQQLFSLMNTMIEESDKSKMGRMNEEKTDRVILKDIKVDKDNKPPPPPPPKKIISKPKAKVKGKQ